MPDTVPSLLVRRCLLALAVILLALALPSLARAFSPALLAAPDLKMDKKHSNNFFQGQSGATYTLTVSNVGTAVTSGAYMVVDTLPAQLTYVSAAGTGWTCGYDPTPAQVTCVRSALIQPGSAATPITVTVNVAVDAPASLTNRAVVSGGGQTASANDEDVDLTLIDPRPDLTITKQHSGDFLQGQTGAAYTITVSNIGDGAANGLALRDTLPSGLVYQSASGGGWSCSYTPATRLLDCSRGAALNAGQSASLTLLVNVTAGAPAQVINTASIAATYDRDPSNNSASDPTTIHSTPDLTISKSHAGNFQQSQNGAEYLLTISNTGVGATFQPVTVTDSLPAGLSPVSMEGVGWTCTLASLSCTRADALAPGASYPAIHLLVDVAPDAPQQVTNRASVSGGGETGTLNNSVEDPTIIDAFPDLIIAKSHSGDFRQGQAGAQYILRVTNLGIGPTRGEVTASDHLPDGLTATAISGEGWQCSLGMLTCTRSDALVSGHTYADIMITLRVADDAPPSLTNQASVAGGGELNTANNQASDTTVIVQAPDLVITKTHAGDFYRGQTGAAFTVTVSNAGGGGTDDVVRVTDVAGMGLTITGMGGTGWSCTPSLWICTRADILHPGKSYPPISVTVSVASDALPSVTNNASVSGGGELNVGNNSASDRAPVLPFVDLQISKTHDGSFLRGQPGRQFALVVSNRGASPSSGTITVTDALPAAFRVVSMSGSGWTCDPAALTCTRADPLLPNQSYPAITLTVDVSPEASGWQTNRAAVTGDDRLPGNNTGEDFVEILPAPDLTVTLQNGGPFRRGQADAVYTLTVRNQGNASTTAPAQVTGSLPEGFTAVSLSGTGWTCAMEAFSCSRADVLAPGASYPPLTLVVSVPPDAPYHVTSQAQVSGGGEVALLNNQAGDVADVYAVPQVTTSPADQAVCSGEQVMLAVTAEGNPAPAVQWQARADAGQGWVDLAGENNPALNLQAGAAMHGWQYRAQLSNAAGSVFSGAATLTVYTLPVVTEEPADQSLRMGQAVTFQAGGQGAPVPALQWQVQAGSAAWQDLPGETRPSLIFPVRPADDGSRFRAVFTNRCGSSATRSAQLQVQAYRLFLPGLFR